MKLLIVEDEAKIAAFLQRGLTEEAHDVVVAATLAAARLELRSHRFDLLLVDRMLPDGDGLTLIRELRSAGDTLPVLCVTAQDRVEERVEGLLDGADDYLVKPFAFEELLARIAAIARRPRAPPELRVKVVADLTIDATRHQVVRAGRDVKLTPQEFSLLWALARQPDRVYTRAELLADVWNTHHDPGTNVVDVYVGYLRRKVDGDGERALIQTVRGVGYRLSTGPSQGPPAGPEAP